MNLGIFLALVTAACFGVYPIIQKKLTTLYSNFQLLTLTQIIQVLIYFLATIFLFEFTYPHTTLQTLILISIGISQALSLKFLLKSYEKISIGETFAIANTYPFLVLIISFFLFSDKISFLQLIAMIIVFFGVLTLSYEKASKKIVSGLKYPIIVAILWTYYSIGFVYLIKQNLNPVATTFEIELISLITMVSFLIFYEENDFVVSKKGIISLLIVGILIGVGVLCVNYALDIYLPAVVLSIVSSRIMINAILGKIFLKEHLPPLKIFGIIAIIGALILFNLS